MKRKLVMLLLAGMFLYTNPAMAAPFPDKQEQVIQDEDKYLEETEKASLAESLAGLPGFYKIVVVESTSPEAQSADEYAQKLYDNYNLPEDALMVVLDMNSGELGVYPGAKLQEQGMTMELLREKIAAYYEPFRTQRKYATGIETFLIEANAELNRGGSQTGEAAVPADADAAAAESGSLFGGVPWWVYAIGAVFAALSVFLIYAMIRRRSIFAQVDEVEDWKDELVGQIQEIEGDKPVRRYGSRTEVPLHVADKKENLLRIRIPDVEMMILDAEEACDRFRFGLALGILDEAREALEQIEQELSELKANLSQVAAAKQENITAIPEIGKQFEQVARRLSDMRLEYGLSFHELKVALDEVESLRGRIKSARVAGDELLAYEMALTAKKSLERLTQALDQVPALVGRVKRELPRVLKQLQEMVEAAESDEFDLSMDGMDNALLQARQLLNAASVALEEGNLEKVGTHVRAFEVLVENTYQGLEAAALAKRQAAASASASMPAVDAADGKRAKQPLQSAPLQSAEPEQGAAEELADELSGAAETGETPPEMQRGKDEQPQPSFADETHDHDVSHQEWAQEERGENGQGFDAPAQSLGRSERDELPNGPESFPPNAAAAAESAHPAHAGDGEEDEYEYELVIPKQEKAVAEEPPSAEAPRLIIESEDDILDEMERISNALVRLRQEIKRSYLPGVPDQLKYMFEEVVATLSRLKTMLEKYHYDLEEAAILIQDASDQLAETENLTERIISTCQMAEGAIQYTNRYRRQNRQVNELLTKAEQAFRQLSFAEAYQLAEEARLVIEGSPQEREPASWLLRRKKKG